MNESPSQRQSLNAILRELRLDSLSQTQKDALMTAVGYEEDVAFAKSLFTEKIATIYRELDGEFEKFIASEAVVRVATQGRQFLMAVFRRYHEEKEKARGRQQGRESGVKGLRLPNTSNIEEVIAFQRRMYDLFRHLIPQQGPPLPPSLFYSPSPPAKFSPFAIFPPERSQRALDPEFPPLPFLPFIHRPSVDSLRRSDSQFDRHSFFSSFAEMQRANSQLQEEERQLKGFTTFGDEEEVFHPRKQVKRESNVNFAPENVETMRKELEFVKARNTPKSMPIDRTMSLPEAADPPAKGHLRRGTAEFDRSPRREKDE